MKEVQLNTFVNKWYNPGNPLKRGVWYFFNIIFFKSYLFPFYSFKRFLLRMWGANIGKGVVIKPGVNIKYPWTLSIGDFSWIGEKVWIDNLADVTIGKNVCISQGAFLLTGNHDFTLTTFDLIMKPISIADGAWIGARTVVCPGTTIESHAILTVGSIAIGQLKAFTIYRGNPAMPEKKRILT